MSRVLVSFDMKLLNGDMGMGWLVGGMNMGWLVYDVGMGWLVDSDMV